MNVKTGSTNHRRLEFETHQRIRNHILIYLNNLNSLCKIRERRSQIDSLRPIDKRLDRLCLSTIQILTTRGIL